MIRSYLERKWEFVRGGIAEVSFENRMVNSVCAITFLMVFLLLFFNVAVSLYEEAFISLAILMVNTYVYYLSRFKKLYRAATYIYAVCSYVALLFVYHYNAGINGPTLFFFFLTFQVIATVTPKKQHAWWALVHVIFASVLCFLEFKYPGVVRPAYEDRGTRFADIIFTFVVSLFFVYLITIHLRNNLDRIRKTSTERAEAIEIHMAEIQQQNERLKEISWLQSHRVRSQVATILGLSQFINQENVEDPDLNRVIGGIKEAARDLDDVIKEINKLTSIVEANK
jgi:two-component system sensor histidine kinase/response regulator